MSDPIITFFDSFIEWIKNLKPVHYLMAGLSGFVMAIAQKFGPQLLSISAGFFETAGEWIFKHIPFADRRNKKKRNGFNSGRIYQELRDVKKQIKPMQKEINFLRKKYFSCASDRAECRAENRMISKRLRAVEMKVG